MLSGVAGALKFKPHVCGLRSLQLSGPWTSPVPTKRRAQGLRKRLSGSTEFQHAQPAPIRHAAHSFALAKLSRNATNMRAAAGCGLLEKPWQFRLRLLMGIEIRLFPVIDAFSRFSGMPLAWFSGLSPRLAKQLLDSTAAASGSGPGLIGAGVAVACWRRFRNPHLAPRIRRILTAANSVTHSDKRSKKNDIIPAIQMPVSEMAFLPINIRCGISCHMRVCC